jgi:hypothetical protein
VVGGEKTDKLFYGFAVTDGVVVVGMSDSYSDDYTAWAAKLDDNGNVLWNKVFGGDVDSAFRSGVFAPNGNYVIAGYEDLQGDGNYDFSLYELNNDGSVVWNHAYGGANSEKAYSVTKATDGYVLVGERQSTETATDAWVLKVDDAGTKTWDKTVGGLAADSPAYVTASNDGGYLVTGFTFSFGAGQRDFWYFKMNTQGQVEFSGTFGNQAFQEAYNIIETNDNSYVLTGWTDPLNQPDLIGQAKYDFYIAKLRPNISGSQTELPYALIVEAVVFSAAITIVLLIALRIRSNKKR